MNMRLDIKVKISDTCVHITDSYTVKKRIVMKDVIKDLKETYDATVLKERSTFGMVNEWVGHNNLYTLGLWESRTKDVDLEYPQAWYYKIIWFLLGLIAL